MDSPKREREKANRWFQDLDNWQKWELGDQLVLGEFDWREWFEAKPSATFMNAIDSARINWEMMRAA